MLSLLDSTHSLSSAMASNWANHTVQVSFLVVNGDTSLPDFGAPHLLWEEVLSNVSVSLSTSLSLDSNFNADDGDDDEDDCVWWAFFLGMSAFAAFETTCCYDCLVSLHLYYSLPHYFWLLFSDRQPHGPGISELASPDQLFSDIALHFLH